MKKLIFCLLLLTSFSVISYAQKPTKGSVVKAGKTGLQGLQGATGVQGPQGLQGDTGAAGADGNQINSTDELTEGSTNFYYSDTKVGNHPDVVANNAKLSATDAHITSLGFLKSTLISELNVNSNSLSQVGLIELADLNANGNNTIILEGGTGVSFFGDGATVQLPTKTGIATTPNDVMLKGQLDTAFIKPNSDATLNKLIIGQFNLGVDEEGELVIKRGIDFSMGLNNSELLLSGKKIKGVTIASNPDEAVNLAQMEAAINDLAASGITGPQGPPGADGANGSDGATGAQGPQGLPGADGLNGTDGATGPQGLPGVNGTNGIDGATGAQGPQGLTGPAGTVGNLFKQFEIVYNLPGGVLSNDALLTADNTNDKIQIGRADSYITIQADVGADNIYIGMNEAGIRDYVVPDESTSESNTGQKDSNGDDIYVKQINFGSVATNGTVVTSSLPSVNFKYARIEATDNLGSSFSGVGDISMSTSSTNIARCWWNGGFVRFQNHSTTVPLSGVKVFAYYTK